jgi:putative transcriptional regulator
MKRNDFQGMLQGVRELGSALKGSKAPIAKVDRIDPQSVAEIRSRLGLSQSEFSRLLGISVDTLQNWEQGRRHPTGAARVLLNIASRHPKIILKAAS